MTIPNIEELSEVENKYLISKNVAHALIENGMKNEKHTMQVINQVYLFKQNSVIKYDLKKEQFEITLISNNIHSQTLIIPVIKENERDMLKTILSDSDGKNLTKGNGTFRIRYYNGKSPEFTMKMKKDGVDGTLEFEYEITEEHFGSTYFQDLFEDHLSNIHSRIVKIRHTIERNGYFYEIDLYADFDFITLEVEFKNEKEQKSFKEDFDFIQDVTHISYYKNKRMAKMQLSKF